MYDCACMHYFLDFTCVNCATPDVMAQAPKDQLWGLAGLATNTWKRLDTFGGFTLGSHLTWTS